MFLGDGSASVESSSSLGKKAEALKVSTSQLDLLIIASTFHQGINEILNSSINSEFL